MHACMIPGLHIAGGTAEATAGRFPRLPHFFGRSLRSRIYIDDFGKGRSFKNVNRGVPRGGLRFGHVRPVDP